MNWGMRDLEVLLSSSLNNEADKNGGKERGGKGDVTCLLDQKANM